MARERKFQMALLSPSIEMSVTGSQFPIPNPPCPFSFPSLLATSAAFQHSAVVTLDVGIERLYDLNVGTTAVVDGSPFSNAHLVS
jgi:hypothetical protein